MLCPKEGLQPAPADSSCHAEPTSIGLGGEDPSSCHIYIFKLFKFAVHLSAIIRRMFFIVFGIQFIAAALPLD